MQLPHMPGAMITTMCFLGTFKRLWTSSKRRLGIPFPTVGTPTPGLFWSAACTACRVRLDWKKHLVNQSNFRIVFLAGRNSLGDRIGTRCPHHERSLRNLHALIEVCPTNCILPNRTIDANRCISYLTIEEKNSIPVDLRSQMGNWVFGCDVCQQVCPWNLKFASPSKEESFSPRPGVASLSLKDELALSPQELNRKFKGSPIKRTKRHEYLRNIAVALGNTKTGIQYPRSRR